MSRGKMFPGNKSEYNIVLLGALGVGKSALTVKYITRRFIMEYDPRIEDIYTKQEDVDGHEFCVNVMDTYEKEGEEDSLQRYLRWADAVMVVYSITDRASFEKARDYMVRTAEYYRTASKDCPVAVVGNKIDLERYRQISKADGQSLASEYDGMFFECSAAEEFMYVEDIFHGMVHCIQRERGERSLAYTPLYIADERTQAQRCRPRSPRTSLEKKEEKSQQKKGTSSFKLFNKSFKIFN